MGAAPGSSGNAPANPVAHREVRESARCPPVRHDECDAHSDPGALLDGGGGDVADVVSPATRAFFGCPGVGAARRRSGAAAQPARAACGRGPGRARSAHRGDLHRRRPAACVHGFGGPFDGRQPDHHRRALPGRSLGDHLRSRFRRRCRAGSHRCVEGRRGLPRSTLDGQQGPARGLCDRARQQRRRRSRRVAGRPGVDAGRDASARAAGSPCWGIRPASGARPSDVRPARRSPTPGSPRWPAKGWWTAPAVRPGSAAPRSSG